MTQSIPPHEPPNEHLKLSQIMALAQYLHTIRYRGPNAFAERELIQALAEDANKSPKPLGF